jgi:hypothetical protein
VSGAHGQGLGTGNGAALAPAATLPRTPVRRRWSNGAVAALVLLGMAATAGLGLYYALRTVPERRARDPKGPLGYVPADSNLLAAVHVADALETPAGRDLFNDPAGRRFGSMLAELERTTGLRRENINQVLFAAHNVAGQTPRLALVVQTIEPYSVTDVTRALSAEGPTERDGKSVYRFQHPPLGECELWCPADNVMLIGLMGKQSLDAVPETPVSGFDNVTPSLRPLLDDPRGRDAHVWFVGDAEQWDKTPLGALALALGKPDQGPEALLRGIQSAGLWLHFDKEIIVAGSCACATPADAERVERGLRKWIGTDGKLERQGNRLDVEAQVTPAALNK